MSPSEVETVDAVLESFERAEPRGLARAITRCESGRGAELIAVLSSRTGRATTIGLTGPPGVGKSTLTSALVRRARESNRTVGVITVDPSSPFSRGALLGDRIRLFEHFVDPGVFIRSMASRGHLGGVAGATGDAMALMDAFGLDVVIVETVGVGQSEIEIAELAATTIVALQPGSGDSIQMLKAGILEIADVFVVNKGDHPMALHLERELRSTLEMLEYSGWVPPVIVTQAIDGLGIGELWGAIASHREYLEASRTMLRKRRAALGHRARGLALGSIERRLDRAIEAYLDARPDAADPYAVARDVSGDLMKPGAETSDAGDQAARVRPPVRATVKGL